MKVKKLLIDMHTCSLQSRQKWQTGSMLREQGTEQRKEKAENVSKSFGSAGALEK